MFEEKRENITYGWLSVVDSGCAWHHVYGTCANVVQMRGGKWDGTGSDSGSGIGIGAGGMRETGRELHRGGQLQMAIA